MSKAKNGINWGQLGVVRDSSGKEVDISNVAWLTKVNISIEDQQPALRFFQDQEAARLLTPGSFETMVCIDLKDSAPDTRRDA